MKLTATWNRNDEEAKLSKADVKRILEADVVLGLDFLQDTMILVQNLYHEALTTAQPRMDVRLIDKSDQ